MRKNAPELACEETIKGMGLVPTKRGWPDFIAASFGQRITYKELTAA